MSDGKWQPLECDPDIMSQLLQLLGVSGKMKVYDVLSFDEEFLNSISGPVFALLFLFPYTKNYKKYLNDLKQRKDVSQAVDSKVYFMRQTVSNSCATLAVIHAVANNTDLVEFDAGSVLKEFIDKTKCLNPEERASIFETNSKFRDFHEVCARLGISEIPSSDSQGEENDWRQGQTDKSSDHHYITFVNVGSKMYELDGYKDFPIQHASTSRKTILKDAARVCLEYVRREPSNINFSALAFGI